MNIQTQIKFIAALAKPEKTPNIVDRARFSQVLETLKICRGFIREGAEHTDHINFSSAQLGFLDTYLRAVGGAPRAFESTFIQPAGEVRQAIEEIVPPITAPPVAAPEAPKPISIKHGPATVAQARADMESAAACLTLQFQTEKPVRTELETP